MGKYKTLVFIAVAVFQFFGPAVGQNSLLNNENSDAQTLERILFIEVRGSQRIEPDTIRSYMTVKPGDLYSEETVDRSLKILFNTGLFADVAIRHENSGLIVFVIENPIINRIDFEGNKALKDDKFEEEVELGPRSVYTRSKVQADVQRLIELYRRSGRFSATIEPKVIRQPQNRVDLIFEINEGPTTGVASINLLGNIRFRDRKLKSQLVTKESSWWRFFSSDDSLFVTNIMSMYFNSIESAKKDKDWTTTTEILNYIQKFQEKYGAEVIPSSYKIKLETKYNHLQLFSNLFMVYFILGFLLFHSMMT